MRELEKKNYSQSFNLVGVVKVNDYTFKTDKKGKNNKDYIYNHLGLNVFCGEKHGDIFCELMGGYSSLNPGVIYAHGRNDDDTDDFANKINVDWNDRNNEVITKDLGELCFIKVGLETDGDNKTVTKKFLSAYDAISYIKAHLKNEMVVNIRGSLKYSVYDGNTQIKKEINSIYLSKAEEKNYKATFRQTVLLSKDSASVKTIDKEKRVLYVNGHVVEYVNGYKDTEYKGLAALPLTMQYEIDLSDMETVKRQIALMFTVKKDVTEITFEGNLVEGGKISKVTYEDLDKELKDLVDAKILTEEEACAKYTDGSKERKMVITKPGTRKIDLDGVPKIEVAKTERKYTDDDLIIDLSKYIKESVETNEEDDEQDVSIIDDDFDFNSLFGGDD